MKLHYQKSVRGNFGDAMNAWLWQRLLPDMWADDGVVFVGIGTLIDRDIPDARLRVVFGSGAGYAPLPDGVAANNGNWKVYGVRGPLTAQVLGLPPGAALTDSAILLSGLDDLRGPTRAGVVFVPHWKSLRFGCWPEICADLGIEFVDPCGDSREVIRRIATARLVIAESMHAGIIADAFRVPWTPVAMSREVSPFKWVDWALSLGIDYRPVCLPPSDAIEALRDRMLRWTVFGNIPGYPSPAAAGSARQLSFVDQDTLIDDFQAHCRRMQRPLRLRSSMLIEAVFKRLAVMQRRTARPPRSNGYFGRARDALGMLAEQPGTLSSEPQHRRALERTLAALELVKSDWANDFAAVRQ